MQEIKDALKQDEVRGNKVKKEALQGAMEQTEQLVHELTDAADKAIYFLKEEHWLTQRFPKGVYNNVAGLCKIVTQDDIAANDYSLTPGRYVEVASHIDEDFDYEERMGEIKAELQSLNEESVALANTIQESLNELRL